MKNIGYIEDFDQAHMFWEAGLRVGLAKANRKFNEVRSQPGIATGMGCSFGVANLISLAVQESASTKIAVCPLSELLALREQLGYGLLITGRGTHPDTMRALAILRKRANTVFIICGDKNSPILRTVRQSKECAVVVCPSGKLPTETAFTPVGSTLFSVAVAIRLGLGQDINALRNSWCSAISESATAAFPKNFMTPSIVHIFAPGAGASAGIDLRNRLNELGGFIPVIHELSGFAHGGYRSLECCPENAAIIFFEDPDTEDLCRWLKKRIPTNFPHITIRTQYTGWRAVLSLFLQQLCVIPKICGAKKHLLSPPTVPTWGNALYMGLGKQL